MEAKWEALKHESTSHPHGSQVHQVFDAADPSRDRRNNSKPSVCEQWKPLNAPFSKVMHNKPPTDLLNSSPDPAIRARPSRTHPFFPPIGAPPILSPSHQRCSSFLRRLLQDLKQQVTEGLGDAAVAARRQVEKVEHVLRDNGPVWVDQVPSNIQKLSLLAQSR